MKDEELYNALEKLNKEKKELLNSKEFKIGNALKQNLLLLKKFNLKKILQNIKGHNNKKKIEKNYCKNIKASKEINNNIDYKTKKIAIYTCIVGNYDNVQKPLISFQNVDYYVFTDYKDKDTDKSFEVKTIEKSLLKKGNILANRYYKFHPSEFLQKYDYAIYIDGNVRIVSDVRKYINSINNKTGIAMYNHRERDDIFQEAEVCKILKRGNLKKIDIQIKGYEIQGFPKNYGMNEATIIVSDLNNKESIRLLDEWYKEFERSGSLRDQIAWPFVLWKNNYNIKDVGSLGNNIFQDNCIEIVRHS